MDLRVISSEAVFAPPHCFELCGQRFDLSLTGKDEKQNDVSIAFMEYPSRELTVTGQEIDSGTYAYDCAKVMDGLYEVAYQCGDDACVVMAVDVAEGTVCLTAVTAGGGFDYDIFSGTIGGTPASARRRPSDELAGNTVDWTFGRDSGSVARVQYGGKRTDAAGGEYGADVQCGGRRINGARYRAYRMRDAAFYQFMCMDDDGTKRLAAAIINYTNMIGAGAVVRTAGGEIVYRRISCYGKIISYTE